MTEEIFVDTNILVYAHDKKAGARHKRAKEVVVACWRSATPPCISVQVLQELYVTLLRRGVTIAKAKDLIRDYSAWRIVTTDVDLLLQATELQQKFSLSYWDAAIVVAALQSGCTELWTEELQAGQKFGSLRICNPLRDC